LLPFCCRGLALALAPHLDQLAIDVVLHRHARDQERALALVLLDEALAL
jgi:hypothetical protein